MQQQSMRSRIDAGHTGMVTLEMERSRSEDAVRILQRRPGGTDLGIFYIRDEARGLFKRRALSVRPERLAEARWLCRFYRLGRLAGAQRTSQDGTEPQKPAAIRAGISSVAWH